MGSAPSKLSHHITPPSSLFDRRGKPSSQNGREKSAKRRGSSTSKRLSLLKSSSRMNKGASSSSRAEDNLHNAALEHSTDSSGGTRPSSRRRTRSVALLQQNEAGSAEEDSERTTSRRIRRRIKGKSRQVEADALPASVGVTNQTKGKKRQTDDDDEMEGTEQAVQSAGQVIEQSSIVEEPTKQSVATQTAPASDVRPPVVDPALATAPASTSTAALPSQPHSTLPPPFLRSPYMHDVSMADRNRARDQIARALGMGPAGHSIGNETPTTDSTQPSMLSALLTDILGLRSGQAVLSGGGGPGSRPQDGSAGIGGRDAPRPRTTNGGTSVIVQGALISRTLPSRPAAPASSAAAAPTMRRSQSQPVESTTVATQEETSEPSSIPENETQVATIEEQAAMLIRLLSIATAATAASLVSRSPQQQQRPGQRSGTESFTTTFPSSSSFPSSAPGSAHASSQTAETNSASPTQTTDPPASPISVASSWRHASQTYQLLRERFSSLRSRFRGQQTEVQTENSQESNAEGMTARATTDAQSGSQRSSGESEQQTRRADAPHEDGASSLRSLSSMLQDAIRDGVSGSERGAAVQGAGSTPVSNPPTSSMPASSQAQSIHATLDAVRGGTLARGSPSSFDRFLFDLMDDLDAAIRGLPRDTQTVQVDPPAPELTAEEQQAVRLRRNSDVHDGQLAFYRQFTFQSFGEPRADDENRLLPCVVVGVRNLDSSSRSMRVEQVHSEAEAGVFLSRDEDTVMRDGAATTTTSPPPPPPTAPAAGITPSTSTASTTLPEERPMSRFLLFVSGGHYPPQHPVFFSSRREASRDLMILMEFLGAMASMHTKPNSTVTKEQIEKSKLRNVTGGHAELASLVKESKIMENTSERCLICLEDWKDEHEDRRLLECAHLFHAPCIDQWLTASNNSCPLCRRQAVATSGPPHSSPPTSLAS